MASADVGEAGQQNHPHKHTTSAASFSLDKRLKGKTSNCKKSKLAEIEHLELLADGLSQSKKRDASKSRKKVEGLKDELAKMT